MAEVKLMATLEVDTETLRDEIRKAIDNGEVRINVARNADGTVSRAKFRVDKRTQTLILSDETEDSVTVTIEPKG